MNEESTKYHLINPVLNAKGYNDPWKIRLETPPPVEPTGFKGRRGKPTGRTDYLIYVRHTSLPRPWPVGVLEAKAEDDQPIAGMQQAKGYAACARHAVQYVSATNGHRFGEFDAGTGHRTGPLPLADFPSHDALSARYARDKGLDMTSPLPPCCFRPTAPPTPGRATSKTPPSAPPLPRCCSVSRPAHHPACC